MDCSLYFQGESYGWEVQLRDDGFFQRFIFKEAAEARRRVAAFERDGWTEVSTVDQPEGR